MVTNRTEDAAQRISPENNGDVPVTGEEKHAPGSGPAGGPAAGQAAGHTNEAAGEQADDPVTDSLEAARREWEKEKQELTGRLLRQRADYENFRRIHRQELERSREDAVCDFIKELLPVLDNLERALGAARQEEGLPPAYAEGLELIHGQLMKVLEKEGVCCMAAQGEAFDPHYHHAVLRAEEGAGEPGMVAEELCRGYLYRGRVLRPAMVKVY